MAKSFLVAAAVSGFFSVAFGAFGAHTLKEKLDAYSLGVFQTGVTYQFFHALALAFVGLLALKLQSDGIRWVGILFISGTIIFSGSLYLLALTGTKALGAITPIGGLAFLVAWALLAKTLFSSPL